jgi:hypothetical protein
MTTLICFLIHSLTSIFISKTFPFHLEMTPFRRRHDLILSWSSLANVPCISDPALPQQTYFFEKENTAPHPTYRGHNLHYGSGSIHDARKTMRQQHNDLQKVPSLSSRTSNLELDPTPFSIPYLVRKICSTTS